MSAMLKSAYSWPSTSRSRDPAADSMNRGGWSYDVRSQLIGTPFGIACCPAAHIARLRGRAAAKAASSRSLSAATRSGSTPDPPTLGSLDLPPDHKLARKRAARFAAVVRSGCAGSDVLAHRSRWQDGPVPTPQHCPSPRELADLELLTGGALAPLTGFNEPGSPVTLELPGALAGQEVELVDPEGLPLATLRPDGSIASLTHAQHGPFRRLHLTPAQTREQHAGATFVPVVDALTEPELERLRAVSGPLVLLALTGPGTPELSPVALLRASLAAARQ